MSSFFGGGGGSNPFGASIDSSEITDGSIVNADINASAAIALSKLASSGNFATTGTGAFTDVLTVNANATNAGRLRLYEDTDNGSSYLELIAPSSLAGNVVLTLPDTDGDASQVLTTNGSGVLTWTTPASGGMTWTEVTGTSQAASVANGYITNNAGLVTVTLPSSAAVGDVVAIVGKGAGGWKLAQNASQTIKITGGTTTSGTGGYLASTGADDCLEVICITADTGWKVRSVVSNAGITVV